MNWIEITITKKKKEKRKILDTHNIFSSLKPRSRRPQETPFCIESWPGPWGSSRLQVGWVVEWCWSGSGSWSRLNSPMPRSDERTACKWAVLLTWIFYCSLEFSSGVTNGFSHWIAAQDKPEMWIGVTLDTKKAKISNKIVQGVRNSNLLQ